MLPFILESFELDHLQFKPQVTIFTEEKISFTSHPIEFTFQSNDLFILFANNGISLRQKSININTGSCHYTTYIALLLLFFPGDSPRFFNWTVSTSHSTCYIETKPGHLATCYSAKIIFITKDNVRRMSPKQSLSATYI